MRGVDADGLNPLQAAFVREYMIDLNATQAVVRAGYSGNLVAAGAQGSTLLKNPKVKAVVARLSAERAERTGITADRVLRELEYSALFDVKDLFDATTGCLLPVHKMPENARRAIASIEVEELFEGKGPGRKWIGNLRKIKLVSKEGTLTLLGKHLKMFTDKVELDVTDSACDLILRAAGVIK